MWALRRRLPGATALPGSARGATRWVRSGDVDQVDDEDQGLAALDRRAGPPVAVAQVRRDDDLAAAADPHAQQALVPAGDDLADAELEAQRLTAVPGRVELLAGRVRDADVVSEHRAARGGLPALADDLVLDDELGRRCVAGEVDLGLAAVHAHGSPRWGAVDRDGGSVLR